MRFDARRDGVFALLIGSFLFAGCNVLAKWIYGHGASQTALFCVRGVIVYFMNAALEGIRLGKASARRVLLLQVGSRRIAGLAVLRSTAGFVGISFLNMSFQVIHLADAFALTLGINTLLTVALARYCIGGSMPIVPPSAAVRLASPASFSSRSQTAALAAIHPTRRASRSRSRRGALSLSSACSAACSAARTRLSRSRARCCSPTTWW